MPGRACSRAQHSLAVLTKGCQTGTFAHIEPRARGERQLQLSTPDATLSLSAGMHEESPKPSTVRTSVDRACAEAQIGNDRHKCDVNVCQILLRGEQLPWARHLLNGDQWNDERTSASGRQRISPRIRSFPNPLDSLSSVAHWISWRSTFWGRQATSCQSCRFPVRLATSLAFVSAETGDSTFSMCFRIANSERGITTDNRPVQTAMRSRTVSRKSRQISREIQGSWSRVDSALAAQASPRCQTRCSFACNAAERSSSRARPQATRLQRRSRGSIEQRGTTHTPARTLLRDRPGRFGSSVAARIEPA